MASTRGKKLGAHFVYASLERRIAAHLLDLLIAGFLGTVLTMYLASFVATLMDVDSSRWLFVLIASVLFVLDYVVYFMVAYAVFSTSVGKYLFGLSVIDGAKGGEVTSLQAVMRSLAYYLSWLPLFVPFVVVLFDAPQRRAIHDHLACTVVVRDVRRTGHAGIAIFSVLFAFFLVAVVIGAFLLGASTV